MNRIVEKLGVRAAAPLVFAVGLSLAQTAGLTAQAWGQSPVRSEGGQSPSQVTLETLVAEAVANNPEIASARHRVDAARERPAQERSLPDPTISMGYDSSGRPWPGAGLGTDPTANIGAMVTQVAAPIQRSRSMTILEILRGFFSGIIKVVCPQCALKKAGRQGMMPK